MLHDPSSISGTSMVEEENQLLQLSSDLHVHHGRHTQAQAQAHTCTHTHTAMHPCMHIHAKLNLIEKLLNFPFFNWKIKVINSFDTVPYVIRHVSSISRV